MSGFVKSAALGLLCMGFASSGLAETRAHNKGLDASDPKGADVHMAYEWATYNPNAPQARAPGAVLTAPGDSYRYTAIRDDDFAHNPDYEVLYAIVGFHLDSSDPEHPGEKWAKVLVNGEARPFLVMFDLDTRKTGSSGLLEVISDAQFSGEAGSSYPPFVYDVTDILKTGADVNVQITNYRKDGQIEGDAPYGGFVVNRVGVHVWYKKK
ncbi:MAG: hypothetical protein COA69_11150 [Robiginitomaculum sp.]|nr:MAG: hypothetical protein COA69_11150 [Robiginitomaculum sp.]